MKLALNGINLGPLMSEGEPPTETVRDIGERTTAADGTTRVSRLRRKKDVTFRSVPLTHAEAHAWLCLLTGEGEAWSFDSSLYGSKGTGPSSTTNASQSAGAAKYGAGKLSVGATTGSITFAAVATNAFGGSSEWTVMVWRFESGFWNWYVVRSDGSQWLNGVVDTPGTPAWLTVSSGNVTLQSVAGVEQLYDDLVVLPFKVLDDWPAQVYAAAVAYGAVPFGRATGDMVTEASSRAVLGVADESPYMVTAEGVLKRLTVELVQQ